MNPLKTRLCSSLAFCAILGAALQGNAQSTVQVDSTKTWVGYVNVYNLVGGAQGGYLWGSGWGTPALTAYFNGTSTATLMPNTNTYNPTDPYWVNPDGSGAKWVEANFYVDTTALGGQTVTFSGTVQSYTLVAPYSAVAFIKEFAPGYSYIGITTVPLVGGSAFTLDRAIGPGNICQYGFMTTGPDAKPATVASLGNVVLVVNNADPALSTVASHALVEGQTASFSVTAQGTAPFHYAWTQITPTATNLLSNGGRFSGATTNTLSIATISLADAGTYSVTVTNTHGTNLATARLTVVPVAQAATNYLIDPGFEQGAFSAFADAGWFPFNAAVESTTSDYYYLSATPVSVVDGTLCARTYSSGPNSYNGFFQDRPATPGEVYTASAWMLTPVEDQIGGDNACYLEVQFRDEADIPLMQYSSAKITASTQPSTWLNLTPTNQFQANFVGNTLYFTNFLGTSPYLVAPAGTAKVRVQITYHSDPVNDWGGSVYADALSLRLREPVVTAAPVGGQMRLSFPTQFAPSYRAYYKTNLTDATWQVLPGAVTGDGTVKTITDSFGAARRFYTVNTQ